MKISYKTIITELLLIATIILAVLSLFLKYVILNDNTYFNVLSENGLYEEIKDSIYERIDKVLSSKNINVDIKESIVNDEDIKKEVNNIVYQTIDYLKTGKNNVQTIDTSIYKQRISEMLDSLMNNIIKPNDANLSLNSKLQIENTAVIINNVRINELNYIRNKLEPGQNSIKIEKLMSKSEAEAKVRELLKQKGLTEEQAIEKARKKGITEDQALKILAGYGITIDDDQPSGNNSVSKDDSNNSSNAQSENGTDEADKKGTLPNNESKANINKTQGNNVAKSKLEIIKDKLLDDVNKSIDNEAEKLNFNKLLQSNKLYRLAQITSIVYKLFWVFIIIPMIIIAILIKKYYKDLILVLKLIGFAFILAGLILGGLSFGMYMLKAYEKINININIAAFREIIFCLIKDVLLKLLKYSEVVFVIGLVTFTPVIIKKYLIRYHK